MFENVELKRQLSTNPDLVVGEWKKEKKIWNPVQHFRTDFIRPKWII
jgi:hypothetical protein